MLHDIYLAVTEMVKVGVEDIKIFSLKAGEPYDMSESLVNVYRNENGLIGYQLLSKGPKEPRILKPC